MKNDADKTKILEELLKNGEKSSTELASIIKRNFYDALKILSELEFENKIQKIQAGKFTFWRVI